MIYNCEFKVTKEFEESKSVSDDVLFRDLAKKIIMDMPFDELSKLFYFDKIDPTSAKSISKIHDFRTCNSEKIELLEMQRQYVLLYSAKINVV